MSRRHCSKPLFLTLLCLSTFATAQVPWHLDYEQGLEAFRAGDFHDAVDSLRKALESNRAPGSRVKLYGTRYIPYYPWFHLGKALYGLAEAGEDDAADYYREAVAAFDTALEYGEVHNEVTLGAEIDALRENAVAQMNRLRQKDEAMSFIAAGKAKLAADDLQSAYEEFLKAAAILGDDPDVQAQVTTTRLAIDDRWRLDLIEQGRRALADEQPEEARRMAQEVLRRFPEDSDANLLLLSVVRHQEEKIALRVRLEAEQERQRQQRAQQLRDEQIREREERLRVLSQVQSALANERFTDARRLNAQILEKNPLDEEARILSDRVVAAEINQREDQQMEASFIDGRNLFEDLKWLDAIRALSQIKPTHFRAAEAATMIERAERELTRVLVTFDSPTDNETIRGETVTLLGRAIASAGIRSATVIVNGELVEPIFAIETGGEPPDSLELDHTISLDEGRNVLVLEVEDTLGRRETLPARTVNVVLPFYRRPFPLLVTSLLLLLAGFTVYIVNKLRREAVMRRNMLELERAVDARTEELMAAQHQLVQSEKMATLGRVASSIAHEINSPLGVIASNKQIYETVWKKLSTAASSERATTATMDVFHSTLENDRVAIGRIEEQINNLRRFASLDEARVKRIAIDDLIDTALAMLERQIEEHAVELARTPDPKRAPRLCRAADLIQVFHGVLEFCVERAADRGTLAVETHSADDSTRVTMEVRLDEPLPMPLEGVFEPQFRTVEGRIGADMNLTLSRHLIQEQGGHLSLECLDRANHPTYRFTLALRSG